MNPTAPGSVAPGSAAGFWKRYVAYFIDIVLLWIALELLGRLFFPSLGSGEMEQLRTMLATTHGSEAEIPDPNAVLMQALGLLTRLTVWTTVAYALVGGAYFTAFESSGWQATPGKRLVGIKVTDAGGARIDRGRALARFLAAALSWLTMNIGHALAAWAPEHRALHDYLAGTRVLDADPSRPQMPWWGWLVIALNGLAVIALMVMTILAVFNTINAANQV